jgi:hypothetical protein
VSLVDQFREGDVIRVVNRPDGTDRLFLIMQVRPTGDRTLTLDLLPDPENDQSP